MNVQGKSFPNASFADERFCLETEEYKKLWNGLFCADNVDVHNFCFIYDAKPTGNMFYPFLRNTFLFSEVNTFVAHRSIAFIFCC